MIEQMQLSPAGQKINGLQLKQRNAALDEARFRIAGPQPSLDDYRAKSYSKYPPEHIRRMKLLGWVLMGAAFIGSSIRILTAAYQTNQEYLTGLGSPWSGLVSLLVAVSSVMLAEIGTVAFTLWGSSIDNEQKWLRWALRAGAVGCVVFTLAANAYVMQPWSAPEQETQVCVVVCVSGSALLAWIETLLPPILVLIAATVLKTQYLHDIADTHAAQSAFNAAETQWNTQLANAHQHADWSRTVANALRDTLMATNRNKTAVLREVTLADWRVLVLRELNAEYWYDQRPTSTHLPALPEPETQPPDTQDASPILPPTQPVSTQIEPRTRTRVTQPAALSARRKETRAGRVSGTHTGELDNTVTQNADGYLATCPDCGRTFAGDNLRSAKNSLVAHTRRCVERAERMNAVTHTQVIQAAEQIIRQTEVQGERSTVSD